MTISLWEAFIALQLVGCIAVLAWVVLCCWDDWKRAALLSITAHLPVKVIQRPGEPRYVEWYHVATPFNLFRVQIHRFLADDEDGMHDHPWSWAASFLLAGEYDEDRRDGTRRRRFGYWMNGDTFHRVRLAPGQREVWTLFIFGPYTKAWGFLRPALEDWQTFRALGMLETSLTPDALTYEPRPRDATRFADWPRHAMKGWQLRHKDENEVGVWFA